MRSLWVLPIVLLFVLLASGRVDGQYDVLVEGPGTGGAWGFPGGNTTHSYRIWNTGTVSDTYDLTATSTAGWATTIEPQISLSPGGYQWVDVGVSVPGGSLAYTSDDLTVRADSTGSAMWDRNFSVTRVYRTASVDVR
ncbi:MAG: hypothetical protein L0Z54_06600, partial [Thermoplasmata archaeon]|nr:hypothetical protein [Thermoplasmata archaeon]